MSSSSFDVVVVGGGVAGLVVARDLAAAGVGVVVLEKTDRLGGQIRSHHLAGQTMDVGAESFATRSGAVAALLADLGVADRMVLPSDGPAWVHGIDGTSLPLPATAVLGIPARPLARDVVDVLGRRGAWRAQLDRIRPPRAPAPDATLGQVVRERMGDAVADRLVAPITRGVYSAEPDALRVAAASPELARRLAAGARLSDAAAAVRAASPAGSQVAGLRGGMSTLISALVDDARAHGARIVTNVTVHGVEATRATVSGWGGVTSVAGTVIAAAPGLASAPSVQRTITVVAAAVTAPSLVPGARGTGVLVAPGSTVRARALTHSSAKWAWLRADAGQHLVRLSYDGTVALSRAAVQDDVRALLAAPEAELGEWHSLTWVRTIRSEPVVPGGPVVVGEAAGESGLAGIVPHARSIAAAISTSGPAAQERQEKGTSR